MRILGLGWLLLLAPPVWAAPELSGSYALRAVFTDAQGRASASGDVWLSVEGRRGAPTFTRSFTRGGSALALRSIRARFLPDLGGGYHVAEVTYPVGPRRGARGALEGTGSAARGLTVYYYWRVEDPASIVEWTRNEDALPFPPLAASAWSELRAEGRRHVVVDLPLGDPDDLDAPPALTLFVYGTLMRGQRWHHQLQGARYLREARTAPRYRLWHLGAYPGLAAGTSVVQGELYLVTPELLAQVDAFEETAPEGYRRARVALEGGAVAWGYLLDRVPRRARPIASGRWE